jgi:two-component system, sensor histidine kinase
MKQRAANALLVASIAVGLIATGLWAYYLHHKLLADEEIARVVGPQGRYYWRAAQYHIAYLRLEQEVLAHKSSRRYDAETLTLRHDVLQSRFHVLKEPVDDLYFADSIPNYHDNLKSLEKVMAAIAVELARFPQEPTALDALLKILATNRDLINSLANDVHHAEMEHWDHAFADFREKRFFIYASSVFFMVLFSSAILLLLFNAQRRKQLIQQQRAALAAEQAASKNAQEAVKAKNVFLGTISHELRTPVQTITSAIDLLIGRPHSERDAPVIKRLEVAAQHLETQMKDLTDYVRLEAGRLELRKSVFDPKELIQLAVDEHAQRAGSQGQRLLFEADTPAGNVISDPARIRQIFNNLLINAIKYSEGGDIRVVLRRSAAEPNQLCLVVADSGPGISFEDQQRLFKPFTQLDQSEARQHEGVGLGLAIVRGLVDLLGGSIHVDSMVGRGTRFEVTIPVEPTSQTPPDKVEERAPHGAYRVLVVDDHQEIRDLFCEMVQRIGYECDVAPDADTAIRRLLERRYEALLLDINMPRKDGFAVASELRKRIGMNQHIPIIAISAYGAEMAEPELRNLLDDYLTKPVRFDLLRATLAKFTFSRIQRRNR